MGREALPELVLVHFRAGLEDSELPFRVDLLEAGDLHETWADGFESMSVLVYPPGPDPDEAIPL